MIAIESLNPEARNLSSSIRKTGGTGVSKNRCVSDLQSKVGCPLSEQGASEFHVCASLYASLMPQHQEERIRDLLESGRLDAPVDDCPLHRKPIFSSDKWSDRISQSRENEL